MSAAYGTGPARTLAALDEQQPRTSFEVAALTGLTEGHTRSILRGLRRDGTAKEQAGRWLRRPGAVFKAAPGHKMDLTLDMVLGSISEAGATASELAEAIQASPHQVGQALRSLRALGSVESRGYRAVIQHGRTVRLPIWRVLAEPPLREPPPPRSPTSRNKAVVYEARFNLNGSRYLLVVEDVLCSIRVWDPREECWMALAHGVLRQDRPQLTAHGWYVDDPDAGDIVASATRAMSRLRRSRELNEYEAPVENHPHQRAGLTAVLRQDLEILRQHGPAQVPVLSAKSGRTTGALWCSLNALRAMGLVERQGTPGCAIFAAAATEKKEEKAA